MKLYYLNPNDYGSQWFVMSDSRESALESILTSIKNSEYANLYKSDIEALESGQLPKGYTLDEYAANQVIESEIA